MTKKTTSIDTNKFETNKKFNNLSTLISNFLINLSGVTATAETYVTSYSIYTNENGIDKEGIVGGRHLFKAEKRDEEWSILHRSTIFDLNQNQNATALWTYTFSENYKSKKDKSDDSYNYIKK